jgi:hypothetical protein
MITGSLSAVNIMRMVVNIPNMDGLLLLHTMRGRGPQAYRLGISRLGRLRVV